MNLHHASHALRSSSTAALVTIVTAAGLSLAAPAAPATAAPAPSLVATAALYPSFTDAYYENAVQYWVNSVRKSHGLPTLSMATCTDNAADAWSSRLASTNTFVHQSMTRLLQQCRATYAGETMGKGSVTPRTLVTMWMHSTAHRAVLMSKNPRRIGIGATPTGSGEWVVVADFMRF